MEGSKPTTNPLISGSVVYLVSNIVNTAIPFILLPVLTRYLSPAEYGEIAMFQLFLGALGALVGFGVVGAAGVKYYDGHLVGHELKNFIAACLQILVASSTITFVIIFTFRAQFSEWLGLQEHWLLLAVAASAASVVVQIRLSQWQVRKEARLYGALQISQSALNMLLTLLLVVALLQGAGGRIASQILAALTFALLAFFLLKRDDLLGFMVWKPAYLKEALAFGVPLIPHIGGMFLISTVDRFVIKTELGLAEVGIYMVAVQLASVMALVFDAINNAMVIRPPEA